MRLLERMDGGEAPLAVCNGTAAAHSEQEALIIQSLQKRVEGSRRHLREVKAAGSGLTATAIERRSQGRPISDEYIRSKRALERLSDEKERGIRQRRAICRQIEENRRELQEFCKHAEHMRSGNHEDYDALQDELQILVDHLTEVCAENAELRQSISRTKVLDPSLSATPLEERAAWAGVLEQAFPADPSPKGKGGRSPSTGSLRSEGYVTPRRGGGSVPGTPSSAKGMSTLRGQGAFVPCTTTLATTHLQVRDTTGQLSAEMAHLEAQLRSERERGATFSQRLETLRTRGRQLEVGLQRNREEATGRLRGLEEDIQCGAQQVRTLMEMAALQGMSSSYRGDSRGSGAEAEAGASKALLDGSSAAEPLGTLQLWSSDSPAATGERRSQGTSKPLGKLSANLHGGSSGTTPTNSLRPRRPRSAGAASVSVWSPQRVGGGAAIAGSGPGLPRTAHPPAHM